MIRLLAVLAAAAVTPPTAAQNTWIVIRTDPAGVGCRLEQRAWNAATWAPVGMFSNDRELKPLNEMPPTREVRFDLGGSDTVMLRLVDGKGRPGRLQQVRVNPRKLESIELRSPSASVASRGQQGEAGGRGGGMEAGRNSGTSGAADDSSTQVLLLFFGAIGVGAVGLMVYLRRNGNGATTTTTVHDWPAALRSRCPQFVPERRLAAGGMGTIFVVRNTRARGRRTAVKVLHAQFADPDAPEALRFLDEARVLEKLAPTGLAPKLLATTADRPAPGAALWFEMEFLDGWETLRVRVGGRTKRALGWPAAQPWFASLINAVGQMHAAGVVHRDLSPENVMVGCTPRELKVIDFGLAKWSGKSYRDDQLRSEHLTQPGEHVGKPRYCAPEQWRDGLAAAGDTADWYSVGVMGWEMIAGEPPFATPDEARVRSPNLAALESQSVPAEAVRQLVAMLQADPRRRLKGTS